MKQKLSVKYAQVTDAHVLLRTKQQQMFKMSIICIITCFQSEASIINRHINNRLFQTITNVHKPSHLAPIKRTYTTFYWWLIVTLTISRMLSKLRWRKDQKSPFGHTPVSFNAIVRGDALWTRSWTLYRLQVDSVGYSFVEHSILYAYRHCAWCGELRKLTDVAKMPKKTRLVG